MPRIRSASATFRSCAVVTSFVLSGTVAFAEESSVGSSSTVAPPPVVVDSTGAPLPAATSPSPNHAEASNIAVASSVSVSERVTLDQAIARALQRNPSAQAAALELDRAEALVRQARAASLPMLNANATYTRLDDDRVLGTRLVAAKNQFNANVALSIPLVAPARWAQWAHARDDANVVRLNGSEVRRQLAISVARTFLTVVSQHRVVEANERALRTARAHEAYAAERLAGGVGRRIDTVRASQQVATTTASVERARMALRRSMEALGILMGMDRPIDVAVEPELENLPQTGTTTDGVANRRDLEVARARRDAAHRRFRDSWIDFLPQVVGQFSPFYQTPSTLTMPQTGWQAMLLVTLPLYDGGARYGARDERRINQDQTELQLMGLLRQARSEVRVAFEAQRAAEAALAAARDSAKLAHQSEQMAILAYEAGASTNLEVIDAERLARDADTEMAIAEDALRQARLDLLIASGRFPKER